MGRKEGSLVLKQSKRWCRVHRELLRSGLTPGVMSGGRYEHLVLLENEQPRAFTGSLHGRRVEDSDSKALVSSENQ